MKLLHYIFLPLIAGAFILRADPYNQDEAFDPGDWFDGNNYEYDDTLDLDLTPNYGYLDGYQREGSESIGYDAESAYRSEVYGRDPGYQPGNTADYGWHYDWNDRKNEWVADYGWHTSKYDYSSNDASLSAAVTGTTARQAPSDESRRRAVQGTIEQVRNLHLGNRSGTARTHSVARLRMEDGRSILVDFGEKLRTPEFHLNNGADVTIKGRTGRINGRHVLFATEASVDGQPFTIDRSTRKSQGQSQSQAATLAGRVQDVSTLYLNNEAGETERFVKIAFEDGRMCLVDLGSVQFEDIGLSEGERISLRGHRDQISGRDIIRANRITINGETTNLNTKTGS